MQTITVEEVKEKMESGETLRILDVREPYEHAQFNIGGVLIPLGEIQAMMVDDIEDWKEEEVIVYCRSGNRSGQACMILETLGFQHPKNMTGGVLRWQEKYGTEGMQG